MCGICGKLQYDPEASVDPELLDRMICAISHRGPDGRGTYISGPIGLGHTRLSIIDLTTGAQPISNEDKTLWVVYNGEIYNFPQLRQELLERGHHFQSTTDTEVIVHLYEEYGVKSLSLLRGMFAFALWDEKDKTLLLARDRVGIKPLYYTNTGKSLVFGSEIKALLANGEVKCQIEPQSIDKFLTHLCLPGKETLWKGIFKLEPGFYLLARSGQLKLGKYWDLRFEQSNRWRSFGDATDELYHLTKKTIRDHMISDVPIGFLLSGGVDSTIVLSCAATETSEKISTFTVGFESAHFEDERPYARLAADRFETEHHEITITPQDFWEFLPALVRSMEEPICDPPAVSLHYISKLARQHVKVLLSGEGGDEAFGGYHDYRNFLALEKVKFALPALKYTFSAMLGAADQFAALRKVAKFSPYFVTAPQEYYYSRASSPFSFFNRNKEVLYTPSLYAAVRPKLSVEIIRNLFHSVGGQPLLNQLQYIDIKTLLPDDLLIKADRITMGNSLELRVPFLDHELLEFAASLPPEYRVKGFKTKRILKKAFGQRIPKEIIRRKKAGFPIPIERWIQGELKDEVREVLLSKKSLDRGYFRRSGVENLLALGDQGKPVAKEIFALLTLELLLLQFIDK
jgi:asparagine synthase (glutamine-hydrolysing)